MLTDFFNGFTDVVAHHPVLAHTANAEHKALQNRRALSGVRDFRVKLHGVKSAFFVCHAGNRAAFGAGHELEARRQFGHLVAVAHPHGEHALAFRCGVVLNAVKQFCMPACAYIGMAKLPLVPAFNLAAELPRHGLHAVANTQHRNAKFKHRRRCLVGGIFVHAGVATGKNHAFEGAVFGVVANPSVGDITGVYFTKNMGIAHAAGDELGDLGAKV